MSLSSRLSSWQARLELVLIGPLDSTTRHNFRWELRSAMVHSLIATIIPFIPIILRRTGASTEQVAYYHAVTALGLLTTNASLWLMRRWGMRRVALVCWVLGRGAFIFTALATNATGLLAVFTVFWLLESWPAPAYIEAMQTIYPARQRGRILAGVRAVLVGITLVLTPLAGWVLDALGYRVLLPLAAFSGVGSALIFFPLMRQMRDSPDTPARARLSARQILRVDRRMPLYLISVLLFGLGTLVAAPLYPAVQVDKLNLSYTVVGWLGLAQSFFWFLGYLVGGRVLDRLGGIRTLQGVFVIAALVMIPYIWATTWWMLLPSFIAAGLVTAGFDLAVLYSIIELAGHQRVPDYVALNSTVSGLRGLIGPFLGSFLVSIGWPFWMVFVLGASFTLAGAGLMALVNKFSAPNWEGGV